MRVCITGGTGFLGKHLVSVLTAAGHQAFPYGTGHGYSDLRGYDGAYSILYESQPDVVIHAACPMGGGNVKYASAKEADLLRDMLRINTNMLEACLRYCVKQVITIGSACEYPDLDDDDYGAHRPRFLWDGLPHESHRAYGLAKRMLSEQGRTYAAQYGMHVTHLILTNLYGPGDKLNDLSHVIPATIVKMLGNPEQIVCWGTGKPTRDFLYVEDAATEILRYIDEPSPGVHNVCSEVSISIDAVVELIRGAVGYKGSVLWDHTKPDGQLSRRLCPSRPLRHFTTFDTGLAKTIQWIKQQLSSPSGSSPASSSSSASST